MCFPDSLYEAHLPGGIARIPLGLDIDAALDAPAGRVRAVVLDEVAPAQRAVVAVAERDRLGIAKPGVVMRLRVPDMEMRVRDREVRSSLQSWRRKSAGAPGRARGVGY